jgi:hypothetical protein
VAQQKRIERIEKLTKRPPERPWYIAAVMSSGVALLCAWRLVTETQQHDVRCCT